MPYRKLENGKFKANSNFGYVHGGSIEKEKQLAKITVIRQLVFPPRES